MRNDPTLPTQLLVRDIELIKGHNILVIGAPDGRIAEEIKKQLPQAVVTMFNFEFNEYQRLLSESGISKHVDFGAWYIPKKIHDAVILYLPKSEALIEMVFNMITTCITSNANVYVVGQKNEGIKSQKETIEKYIGPIGYSDSARHSTIYQASFAQSKTERDTLSKWFGTYEFELKGQTYAAASLPGVFSHGKLDDGTKLLLENLSIQTDSQVLDWGCGSGVIGLVIQKLQPTAQVDMVDSNALALEASRKTMEMHELPFENIWATDVFSEVKGSYDLIISNPPFHSGVGTDYSMVEKFIAEAKTHLNKKGKLLVVANSFLRYKPLIEESFGNCEVLAENKAYKMYQASNT